MLTFLKVSIKSLQKDSLSKSSFLLYFKIVLILKLTMIDGIILANSPPPRYCDHTPTPCHACRCVYCCGQGILLHPNPLALGLTTWLAGPMGCRQKWQALETSRVNTRPLELLWSTLRRAPSGRWNPFSTGHRKEVFGVCLKLKTCCLRLGPDKLGPA